MPFEVTYRSIAVVIGEGQVGHARVDGKTVVTIINVRALDNDTRGRADVECISVLCWIARCGNGVNVKIFQNSVLGAANAEMSAWGLNDLEATEH